MREYLCQFGDISVDIGVQFRAEDDQDLIPQQVVVKTCVGKGDAVGRDEEISILKIRGCGVQERELDRPLAEF